MEFLFDVTDVLPGRITIVDSKDSSSSLQIYDANRAIESHHGKCGTTWTYTFSSDTPSDMKIKRKMEKLENIVDSIGVASAKAQNLQAPITTLKNMVQSHPQKLYIMRDVEKHKCVVGMLKVGIKHLFVNDNKGGNHEGEALCVLDFYFHESKDAVSDRNGFRELFDFMLKAERITPEKLAVDSPSRKCLQFLQKHYSLNDPIEQNNGFVIYPGFFQDEAAVPQLHSNIRQKASDTNHSMHFIPDYQRANDIKGKSLNSGNFMDFDNCEGNEQDPRKQKVPFDGNTHIAGDYLSKGVQSGVRQAMHPNN